MGFRLSTLVLGAVLVSACSSSVAPSVPSTDATAPASAKGAAAGFEQWKSVDAIVAFQRADLDVAGTRPMTRDDFGMAPYVAVEGTRFQIASLAVDEDGDGKIDEEEADTGGRAMSFRSAADLAKTKAYYDDLGKESAVLYSYTFVKGNLLVQINGDLSESSASSYNRALQSLGD